MHSRRSLLLAGLAAPLPLLPQATTKRPPAIESALVKDFVIAGHVELEKVQTMLAARLDLFAAAMLGKIDIIKAALVSFPNAHQSLGPHKIPMIAHAKKGGEEAVSVVKLLETYQSASASAISIG